MVGFFDRMLGRGKETSSAHQAKERLQFVLVHDRINLPPERLKAMKDEILAVISKYVDVDSDEVDIALEQRDRHNNMLVAEIPFTKSRPIIDPIVEEEAQLESEKADDEDQDKTEETGTEEDQAQTS